MFEELCLSEFGFGSYQKDGVMSGAERIMVLRKYTLVCHHPESFGNFILSTMWVRDLSPVVPA